MSMMNPTGGGQGMLLRAQPIFDTFDAIEKKNPASFFWILLGNSLIRLMLKIWLQKKNSSLSVVTTRAMTSALRPW